MSKRFLITIITILAVGVFAAIVIMLAKGYTFSPTEKRLVGTGIINISSEPDAASVYLDDHLTTATNTTIASLTPKNYKVRVVKEGFIPWEKQILVKEGLVTEVKATLFPAIPTIYPLTFNGVENPTLSPDGGRLAYIVPVTEGASNRKAGVWVWTQTRNQPISFARSAEPRQIAQSTIIDFSKATLRWSSDSKQILATAGINNYLLEADRLNDDPRDITPILDATLKSWEEDMQNKDHSRILAIKDSRIRQIASSSAILKWSPDETKFMRGEKEGDLKVLDLEDEEEYSLPSASQHIWLPDSRHIILISEGTISIVDFDGINKAVIYAGSFKDDFVFPWLDSSRLVIITSFPTPTASEPNLYGINLK